MIFSVTVAIAFLIAFLTSKVLHKLLPRKKLYILSLFTYATTAFTIHTMFQVSMGLATATVALILIGFTYLYNRRMEGTVKA